MYYMLKRLWWRSSEVHQPSPAVLYPDHIGYPCVWAAGTTAVSNEFTSSDGKTVAAARTTPSGSLHTQTISLDSAQMSRSTKVEGIKLLHKDGSPVQISNVFITAGSAGKGFSKASPSAQPAIGVSAADGRLLLAKGSEVVWQREEALAEVSAALFVDLPADAQSADRVDANRDKTGVMDHIQSQFLSLKVSPAVADVFVLNSAACKEKLRLCSAIKLLQH